LVEGGTVDQWNYYHIKSNAFEFLEPLKNKPRNIEYLTPDIVEYWKIHADGRYSIIDNAEILLTGGDNASGMALNANTLRYLAQFKYHGREQFKEYDTGSLFTIKDEYFRNIPIVVEKDDDESMYKSACKYFIEYAGKEQNTKVPFHYPNQIVLYTIC